jgi:hypothetical protein
VRVRKGQSLFSGESMREGKRACERVKNPPTVCRKGLAFAIRENERACRVAERSEPLGSVFFAYFLPRYLL